MAGFQVSECTAAVSLTAWVRQQVEMKTKVCAYTKTREKAATRSQGKLKI